MIRQLIQKKKSNMCLKCAKTAKSVGFGTEKKVKLNSSLVFVLCLCTKNSTVVSQIDCKKTKDKSKLPVKCFINSFTKNPPISARNVPKLPGMSLFEPRKKSKKMIVISKLALR